MLTKVLRDSDTLLIILLYKISHVIGSSRSSWSQLFEVLGLNCSI